MYLLISYAHTWRSVEWRRLSLGKTSLLLRARSTSTLTMSNHMPSFMRKSSTEFTG